MEPILILESGHGASKQKQSSNDWLWFVYHDNVRVFLFLPGDIFHAMSLPDFVSSGLRQGGLLLLSLCEETFGDISSYSNVTETTFLRQGKGKHHTMLQTQRTFLFVPYVVAHQLMYPFMRAATAS